MWLSTWTVALSPKHFNSVRSHERITLPAWNKKKNYIKYGHRFIYLNIFFNLFISVQERKNNWRNLIISVIQVHEIVTMGRCQWGAKWDGGGLKNEHQTKLDSRNKSYSSNSLLYILWTSRKKRLQWFNQKVIRSRRKIWLPWIYTVKCYTISHKYVQIRLT